MSQARFTDHIIVPVADPDDARATATALKPYDVGQVTVLSVVEKGGGVPDKTPVEQSEDLAADSFTTFRAVWPDATTEITYATDVVAGILDAAEDHNASAIVFCPRRGSRIRQFLSGDRTLRLVTEADRPVITVPDGEPE